MGKVDFKKEFKNLYGPSSRTPVIVEVPAMNFLMVDGSGNPNTSQEYTAAIEALYPMSYTLKFMAKQGELQQDYTVMPLEGLWWAEDMDVFLDGRKDEWLWTAMIMQPDFISAAMVEEAREVVRGKKNPAALDKLRFESLEEGTAGQIMYIGPYSDEGPTIQALHEFIENQGFELSGKHHEIYLSDPRRTAPGKLKTIIRQPCHSLAESDRPRQTSQNSHTGT